MAPHWSPAGQLIVHLSSSLYMQADMHVCVTPIYGETRSLTSEFDYRSFQPQWSPDGESVYFLAEKEGNVSLYTIPVEGGEVKRIINAEGYVECYDVSKDGTIVYVASNPTNPSDLWIYDSLTNDSVQLSHLNERLQNMELVHPTCFWYESFDGLPIQGWYYLPIGYEDGEKYPLILKIHGGPTMMWGNDFDLEAQLLATKGYVVAKINPRGSTGYGNAFALPEGVSSGEKFYSEFDLLLEWGLEKAYEDLMLGIDYLIEEGFVDKERMGVMGRSWGGYLTLWAISHTDRFKAAVAERAIGINWQTIVLACDTAVPVEIPWEEIDRFNKKYSVIFHVDQIKTPVLITVGMKDFHVTPWTHLELFSALQCEGVPTELVFYPREKHSYREAGHKVDRMNRIVDWFDHYLENQN